MTKSNNQDVIAWMKISFDCNLPFSKIIVFATTMELNWQVSLASDQINDRTTYEFGQTHILDLDEFDSSIKEISMKPTDNGSFTLKGLRLVGFSS